jgi:phage/plasmid-associated DNA primase
MESYERKWGISPEDPHKCESFGEILQLAKNVIGISSGEKINATLEKFNTHIDELVDITNSCRSDDFDMQVRINRLLQIAYYARSIYVGLHNVNAAMDLKQDFRDCTDASLFRFKAIDTTDNTKYQNFLLFILSTFYENGYRRSNGSVYKTIKDTYAWQRLDSIPRVIYKCVKKECNYDQFLNLTSQGNAVRNATEFLENCVDSQFPVLNKNRHAFSFRNGIYFADSDSFQLYSDTIPENTMTSKYFDIDFTPCQNKEEIQTPFLDSILTYQDLSQDVINWVYALIGRVIYKLDDKDGWQIIPFFQGQAGCGKSTILLNVFKQIYDDEDVGVMSNNIQRTFGLSDLVDKIIYIAPEIKRDFNMEQGEFQSIVSGDKVTINIKYKLSRFENWDIPGAMAGNEVPDFIDNSGSIQRRIVTIKFRKRVLDSDLNLGKKLQTEMANIIQKCNKWYLYFSETSGRKNIWTVLPEYFKETQKELAAATNPLIHFLASGKLTFTDNVFISEENFITMFNAHCSENNYKRCRFNSDFFSGPFQQYNLKKAKNMILGASPKSETPEFTDEDPA